MKLRLVYTALLSLVGKSENNVRNAEQKAAKGSKLTGVCTNGRGDGYLGGVFI